ncbi:hypothetical protein ACNOYE_32330 [Nannocystaceae bacterium ST9]
MVAIRDRGALRWASGFVALVWVVNFVACSSTKGMVPGVIADITSATDQLGEASFVGTIVVVAADLVLAVAALGFYGVMWWTWLGKFPPRVGPNEASEQGRILAVQLALGAEIRVFFHLALVLFATGNFAPFGPVGLATQIAAAASIVVAMIVLRRAGRLAGPPHGDLWLVAALIVALAAGTEAWVALQP